MSTPVLIAAAISALVAGAFVYFLAGAEYKHADFRFLPWKGVAAFSLSYALMAGGLIGLVWAALRAF